MKLQSLLKSGDTFEHLLVAPTTEAHDALTALAADAKNNCTVRFLRGPKCSDRAGFFDESAAALQFPIHFGENWDAFNDTFGDLPHITTANLVVVVLEADSFLSSPKDALKNFRDIAKEVAGHLAKGGKGKSARHLHVVYQAESEAVSARLPGVTKLI